MEKNNNIEIGELGLKWRSNQLDFAWLRIAESEIAGFDHRGSQRAAVEWRLHKLIMAVNRAYSQRPIQNVQITRPKFRLDWREVDQMTKKHQ